MEIDFGNTTLGRDVKQAQVMGSRELSIGYRPNRQVFLDKQETFATTRGYSIENSEVQGNLR